MSQEIKSKEKVVTDTMVSWLEFNLNNDQSVKEGEHSLISGINWRCDIVIKNKGYNVLAIECKGDENIRRGVGQALSYRYLIGKAGIAGYNLSKEEIDFISELPLYCFNIIDKEGFKDVIIESKPYSNYGEIGFPNLNKDKDIIMLRNRIQKLARENRELMEKYNLKSIDSSAEEHSSLLEDKNETSTNFIVKSAVKRYFNNKRVSQRFYTELDDVVESMVYEAVETAKKNNRRTVMPRDL